MDEARRTADGRGPRNPGSRPRLGVFGGTFDPIHVGHIAVADALSTRFRFDRLLFVPAFVPPHKIGREIESPYHRFAMVALAVAQRADWLVSEIEVEAPSRPFSVDTVARLNGAFPESAPLYFVIGADSFEDLPLWREYLRLVDSCHMIVSARPGHELGFEKMPEAVRRRIVDLRGTAAQTGFPDPGEAETRIYLTEDVFVDVSSTSIRKSVRAGSSPRGSVPDVVASYIEKHNLYGRD
jgi:nicotinate-nucleotide adenylyltransferase